MSDIRLKKITVEPSQVLTIQRGDINVTNTTISTNRLNGAVIIDGGLGINSTYDSSSSTSGGALTIGGGLAVHNRTFFGNDVTLDNNASTLSLNGININRLFVDSVSNKYLYLSPDGMSKRLELFDTKLNIHITTHSTNATTGAFIIDGGISINATEDVTDSSNGGSLTVAGGVAVGGNVMFSKTLTIGQLYTDEIGLLVRYTGDSQIALQNSSGSSSTTFNMEGDDLVVATENDMLFKTTTGNFIFSNASTNNTLLTIGDYSSNFHKIVNITDTIESKNVTTASLIVKGGVTIQCTTDALASTTGNGLTIYGGLGVSKKTYIGDSLGLELWNTTKNNKFLLYQAQQTVTEENIFTGLGVTAGSLRLQVYDTNKDFTFFSSSIGGDSTEVFRIKGTNEVQFVGDNQRYSILAGGNTNNDLSIQGQNIAESSSVCFFTKDGDTNDTNDIKIFGLGQPNNVNDSEYLKMGWDTNNYIISTNKTGTGNSSQLILQTNSHIEQLKFLTDGSMYMSSTKDSTNSSSGGLVMQGGLSINNTNDALYLTSGGALTVAGGVSIEKSVHVGNTVNIYSTAGNISLYAQNADGDFVITNPSDRYVFSNNDLNTPSTSSIEIYGLNNMKTDNFELLEIICNSTSANGVYNIHTDADGTGILKPLQLNVGTNTHLFLHTNGNVGVNMTSPEYQLDINGTVRANDYNYINQLTIYNTEEAYDEFTSGSLTVEGGTSIAKNLYVGGLAHFTNTMDSTSTSGAVYIAGGLTVATGQASNFGSGALTVNGGAYIGGEIYIQQNLNVQGQINGGGASSSTFAYLTLTATDESLNLSTGSLLTFGGITIQTYTNAENVSNGGSFLTPGGASVGKDVYIGGDLYNYGVQNFYDNKNALVNFYDLSNLKRFSIDRNTVTNNFSISRYDSSGTFVEKTIDISNSNGQIKLNNSTNSTGLSSGSLITVGGITVQTTAVSANVQNGGGLTVFGGASIVKNMYVGGDVVLLSTTNSSNANEGALIVSGGVGVTGNVNVLGNMVVTGNVSIIGTTNTVYSTNTLLSDNILVINSGPAGSSDGGILIQRYQINNDMSDGDVVNDTSNQHETYTLPNQSGMTTTQLKLPVSSSNIDNIYKGWWIKITSGFSVNQVRKVTGYVGSTRVLTVENSWTNQNPSFGDTIQLYNKPYVGLLWNENIDTFELGTSTSDPGTGTVSLTEFASLGLSSILVHDTINSTSSSVGSIVSEGGISIKCSTEATSLTRGGGLTVAGGSSIAKSLYVGNRVYIGGVDITPNIHDQFSTITFTAANNVTSQNIPTIYYNDDSVWGFDLYLSARLIATNNLYGNYHVRAINKGTSWEIVSNYVGDSILSFNITNDGQLQYSTPNFTGFSNLTFKYKVLTN